MARPFASTNVPTIRKVDLFPFVPTEQTANPWKIYEARKRVLASQPLTPDEYEYEVGRLAKEIGV